MSKLKTQVNDADVTAFINSVPDVHKREDAFTLLELYTSITGKPAKMWGTSIIGFGSYHYKSDRSSQEGDWPLVSFSPRKQNLTLYFMSGFEDYEDKLKKLGKHKISKGCLYITKLSDVDIKVLKDIIHDAYDTMKKNYT